MSRTCFCFTKLQQKQVFSKYCAPFLLFLFPFRKIKKGTSFPSCGHSLICILLTPSGSGTRCSRRKTCLRRPSPSSSHTSTRYTSFTPPSSRILSSACFLGRYRTCFPGSYRTFFPGRYRRCFPGGYRTCFPGGYRACFPGRYRNMLSW